MMDLVKTLKISAAGMRTQGTRLRVISENIANANSLPQNPQEQPYRRKLITFRNALDRVLGTKTVQVRRVFEGGGEFPTKFDPGHPAADADGYVKTPNVNTLVEMMDMREAQRSYEANLSVIEVSKRMLLHTIDMLRG